MRNRLKDSKIICGNKKSLFLFELIFKVAFLIIVVPLFQWSLEGTLKFSSFSYLTIENIAAYLRSPFTLFIFICLLLIVGVLVSLEFVSLIIFFYSSIKKQDVNVEQILFPGFRRLGMVFRRKGNIWMIGFSLITLLFMIFPLIVAIFIRLRIPSYIIQKIMKEELFLYILIILLFILLVIFILGIFTLHFCTLEGKNFKEAFRSSRNLQKGNRLKIIKSLAIRNIFLIIVYFLAYFGVLLIAGIIIYFVVDDHLMIAVYFTVCDKVNLIVGVLAATASLVVNINLVTKLFVQFREQQGEDSPGYEIEKMQEEIAFIGEKNEVNASKREFIVHGGRYRFMMRLMVLVLIVSGTFFFVQWFRHGSFSSQQTLFGIYVTAHRGASAIAPENTIPAVEQAIASYADYAEIDVQETRDGVVVLLHDNSINRTTNGNGNIWNIIYLDLLQLDAGSWFSKNFESTYVPTLEEVLQLSKGIIKLNIEIKMNGHNATIIEKVVMLIDAFDFEQQCVVSSSNYAALAKVKELNSNIKTGYIMSLAYGNFYDSEYADFFSVKSSFINETMVKLAHSLGKEVHSWTVNSKAEMERMKKLGVDNIITDYPVLAREVIYGDEGETLFGILRLLLR